jgi:hypothetical protein
MFLFYKEKHDHGLVISICSLAYSFPLNYLQNTNGIPVIHYRPPSIRTFSFNVPNNPNMADVRSFFTLEQHKSELIGPMRSELSKH